MCAAANLAAAFFDIIRRVIPMQEKYAVITKEFSCISPIGQTIRGKIYLPEKSGRLRTLIVSHGFGGNYRTLEHHGSDIASHGIACIFYDFCGGGMDSLSDGRMDQMTLKTEEGDLLSVIEYAKKMPFVDPSRLYLLGESQGGMVSALAASLRTGDIKGLVLWYPAFVIPDDSAKRKQAGRPEVFGIKLSPEYDDVAAAINVTAVQKAYPGPVLIIHGDADPVVPTDYSYRAEKSYPNARLIVLPGAAHGFNAAEGIKARTETIRFLLADE